MHEDEEIVREVEDEEIVCEGNCLYQHLVNVGYGDFETFVNDSSMTEEAVVQLDVNDANDQNVNLESNVSVTSDQKDNKMLVSILNSQLVFKEDAFIVDCAVSNMNISENKSPFLKICTSIVLGLMSSTLAFKRSPTGFYYLSCCLALAYSGYLSWTFIKNNLQSKRSKILSDYLKISRELCLDINKHLRFLNEIQTLSTAKFPTERRGVNNMLYNRTADLNTLHEKHEAYPHLRKCLSDSLGEIIAILILNKDSLRNSQMFSLLFDNYYVPNSCDPNEIISKIINSDEPISIKVLKQMSELYLVLQSEYLRDIGLILAPVTESLSALRSLAQKEAFGQLSSCQNKLANIHLKLLMQYQLHSILLNGKRTDNATSNIQPLSKTLGVLGNEKRLELKHVRMDIHNIFLILYSALLRVKNVEDCLENISDEDVYEKEQIYSKLVSEISEQMSALKDDLSSTVSCFDAMSQQMRGKNKNHVNTPKTLDKVTPSDSSQEVKETIFLGKTDFSMNSLDEVFLGISDLNYGEPSEHFDDWCLEKKPQIPKNLLVELSNTLKSRKEDFIQRERAAVERQGLQELEKNVVSDSSSDEDSITRTYLVRAKRGVRNQSSSESSSDCGEDRSQQNYDQEKKSKVPKFCKNKKRTPNDHSGEDLSSDEDFIDERPLDQNVFTNTSLLANLIATKSQMWGNKTEDLFSDG